MSCNEHPENAGEEAGDWVDDGLGETSHGKQHRRNQKRKPRTSQKPTRVIGIELPIQDAKSPAHEISVISSNPTATDINRLTLTAASDIRGQYPMMSDWLQTDVLILTGALSLDGKEASFEQALNHIRLLRKKYDVILVSPGPSETAYWRAHKSGDLNRYEDILTAKTNLIWDKKGGVRAEELIGRAFLCTYKRQFSILGLNLHLEQYLPSYLSNEYTDLFTAPDEEPVLERDVHVFVTYLPPLTVRDAGLGKRPGEDIEQSMHVGSEHGLSLLRHSLKSEKSNLVAYIASTPEDNWGITQTCLVDVDSQMPTETTSDANSINLTENKQDDILMKNKVIYVANSSVITGKYPNCGMRPPIITEFVIYPQSYLSQVPESSIIHSIQLDRI